MDNTQALEQFREAVHDSFTRRADAALDLVDALTGAGQVDSPVALSEAASFQRKFSSVYDVLQHAEVDLAELERVLYEAQPSTCEVVEGYEVYAFDATPNPREAADTLADRASLKSSKDGPAPSGHKYSWLVRWVERGTAWIAPLNVTRIATTTTDSQVAAEQVKALDQLSDRPKLVMGDSLYGNVVFLAVLLIVDTVVALVRMRHNLTLYERPTPKAPGEKGAPRKHGAKFKLSKPGRAPDRTASHPFGLFNLRLHAWHALHFKRLAGLEGMALCVEILKSDGTPLFQRPIWLFWTGPLTLPLHTLAELYCWRFGIEHAFRFLKQHLGLNANPSTDLHSTQLWMWLCALAYWQLLLLRPRVADARPAWYPRCVNGQPKPLTAGLVQRAAGRFLCRFGSPARPPKSSGKGTGRKKGLRPQPHPRFKVVRKGKKQSTHA